MDSITEDRIWSGTAVFIILLLPASASIWLILEVLNIVNFTTISTPLKANSFSKILGAVGSLALSLVLAILYRQQTNIQKRQERWMEANHTPEIIIEDWEVDGNRVILNLANLGNGVASNLRLALRLKLATNKRLNDPNGTQLDMDDSMATSLQQNTSDPLKFSTVPRLEAQYYAKELDGTFTDIANQLKEEGVEVLHFTVELKYDYIAQKSTRKEIWSASVELEENLNFEAAVVSILEELPSELDHPPANITGI